MIRLKDFEPLVEELLELDALAKRRIARARADV
jgi:hypothetical protein